MLPKKENCWVPLTRTVVMTDDLRRSVILPSFGSHGVHWLHGVAVALWYGVEEWISMMILILGYEVAPNISDAPLTHLSL